MVWFQCEDCGENLKKPKLPSHFRICSATKLSCIDCGVIFSQESVQSHVQCITEAEKYGPKGQVKPLNGLTPKSVKNDNHQPDFDIYVGLSQRPPWFCSICNTSATSKQTLLGHAEGKKHRAKARAFHSANQPSKPAEDSIPPSDGAVNHDALQHIEAKTSTPSPITDNCPSRADVEKSQSKKRKLESCDKKTSLDAEETVNAQEISTKKTDADEIKGLKAKAKLNATKDDASSEERKHKIKWRKLIKSALKTNPEGTLKMRKLERMVISSLKESGFTEAKSEFRGILAEKISSCSRFRVDGKHVHLVAKA